ncbi:MAG TPA: CDP-glycerol glycerophosphotransferase family protein [Nocardioidaceae bacterium]|nr:CDP-glycerol glycerophosphotransferase family protein [Nocardioidaceae bacterium]
MIALLRRRAVRLLRELSVLRPVVSVLVDATADAALVDASLDSVRAQPVAGLEIVVVGPGMDARVARHLDEDWRVRRGDGRRSARGRYVLCLQPGDRLAGGAIEALLAGIGASGASVALGSTAHDVPRAPLAADGRSKGLRNHPDAASGRTSPTRLGAAPQLVWPLRSARMLFRRKGLGPSVLTADPVELVDALLAAPSVVGVPTVTLLDPAPRDARFGVVDDPTPELARWLERSREIEGVLGRPGDESVLDAWRRGWLAGEADRFLDAAERMDAQQWAALSDHVRVVVDGLATSGFAEVPVEPRVKAWLAAQDRRADLEAFVLARRFEQGEYPTDVRDGQVFAVLPVDLPPDLLRLGETETPLVTSLRRLRDSAPGDEGTARVQLVAYVDRVSVPQTPDVTVLLDGQQLQVDPAPDPEVTIEAGSRFQDYARASWGVDVPTSAGPAELEVRVDVQGVRRTATQPLDLSHLPAAPAREDRPLADDERGRYAQARLQEEYAARRGSVPLDPQLAYFQSYDGRSATDSPVAIHAELRRRRPDLRTVWAVRDLAAAIPEGAEPVLWGSRAWYDVLARTTYVVTNIEMERWFRRRDGQQLVQTFHGYPSKTMGIGLWRDKGFTDSRIAQQLERTSRQWSLLVTPSPEMDGYYREHYAYDGRIVAAGYPRDDVLVGPDADRIRDDVRRRLGIGAGKTAVLYAPTWRDDLATNYRAARAGDFFDVDAAATALGEGFVLLLRGHRFHPPHTSPGKTGRARLIDVTDHPEVNDLILASDAAVLDYSSLRFDYALTGRPMIFLVPDVSEYTAHTRGFLFDFAPTAPGPWADDTAGVVAALRDLPAVAAAHRAAYDAFNQRFNRLNDGHAAERVVTALLE